MKFLATIAYFVYFGKINIHGGNRSNSNLIIRRYNMQFLVDRDATFTKTGIELETLMTSKDK